MATGAAVPTKPPNLLVLWPSGRFTEEEGSREDYAFQQVREELASCLDAECYAVYPLTRERASRTPWKENCSLLILPPALPSKPSEPPAAEIYREVLAYLRHHSGRVLSMDCGFNSQLGFPVPAEGGTIRRDRMFRVTVRPREDSDGESGLLSFDTLGVTFTPAQIAEQLNERGQREEEGDDLRTCLPPSSLELTEEEGGQIKTEEEGGEGDDNSAVCSTDDSPLAFVDLSESRQPADSSPSDPATSVPCVRKLSFGKSGSAVLCHVDLLPVLSALSKILMRMDAMMKLSESAESRREFLTSVLQGMGVECRPQVTPQLTQGYLVCSSRVRAWATFLRHNSYSVV